MIRDSFAVDNGHGEMVGGFRETCDIMSMCAAGISVIYFFVNVLPHFFMKSKPKRVA
jgi:hypothetical protein